MFPLLVSLCLQVAIIAGNFELAELIKNHKATDIGEFSSSILLRSLQCVFLNLPQDTFQIPPQFDPRR